MERAISDALTALDAGASRHDAALAATNRIAWLTGQGHTGGAGATDTIGGAFITATGRDRGPGEAQAELDRMIAGAIDLAAAAHPTTQPDPCDDPFAGLIAPRAAPQEQPCPTPSSSPPPATTPGAPASPTAPTTTAPAATAIAATWVEADASTATDTTQQLDDTTPERTSWWPRDLDAALGNTDPEPPPSHLTRGDGHAAFYRGRVNGLIGPSESGKTWVALHAVHQALDLDQAVTYIDFEDSEKGIVGRLLTLGAHPDQLLEHFRYIGPDEPFHRFLPTGIDLHEHLEQHQPELVILDGVNAAMTLQGLDLNSNKDATTFAQQILKPLTVRDTTVVYIDHTPKDSENTSKGGIGAQAKRAMTSGCTLRVDAVKPFGKGQDGRLRIHVDKDRQGDVRGISAPSKGTHWFGDFTLTHNPAEGTVDASLDAPEGFDPDQPAQPATFRPTGYMEKVSRYIQDHPGVGRNEIVDAVPGNDKHIKTALRVLVEEGWVTVEKGARNKSLHTLDTPFNELLSPPTNDRGPTGGHTGCQPPVETTGGSGGRDRDVVPSHPDPSHQLHDPTHTTEGSGPQSHLVERIVAGRRVLYDPTTNQTVDIHTGEVDNP
ncbi:AAA family ATPase [Janibacter melonis]|uniref:AAA family ATPase n=1 Tax=Janibacter melonis TaxID=262209 RepID=UPI0017499A38|nr:AAA family ATPase [Janibacter melonis]